MASLRAHIRIAQLLLAVSAITASPFGEAECSAHHSFSTIQLAIEAEAVIFRPSPIHAPVLPEGLCRYDF